MKGSPPPLLSWMATLSDMARLRILRLLDREELSVGELARALQLPQSTVSRHLKVLHDGEWVGKRVEGTASYYRLIADNLPSGAGQLWELTRSHLGSTPTLAEDEHRLAEVLAERMTDSRSFFGRVGGEWDQLRQELFGSNFTSEALLDLVRAEWVVADLGCGTGNAAAHLAPLVQTVIAVDREPAMLEAGRKRLAGFDNVDFRLGDLTDLPIADASLDVAVVILVLHHFDEPARAVAEMARVLRPEGTALIVDMVAHDRESYRYSMGHRHLGFSEEQVRSWAAAAGLRPRRLRRLRPRTSAKGPGLFVATMTR
jgi:ArsR family transcriptional regulator